jgi:uncharacterized protein YcfJ
MRHTLLLGLVAASVSLPAFASHELQDQARVLSVTPQVQQVNTPTQECHTEYVRESVYQGGQRSNTGAVVGGVAGGLLGGTVGKGGGRIVASVLGAGIGAIVGDRLDNNRPYQQQERVVSRPVDQCTSVDHWANVTTGYLVNYEYNGHQYSTVTDRDPGRYIAVNVVVQPRDDVTRIEYRSERGDYDNGRHGQRRDRDYW